VQKLFNWCNPICQSLPLFSELLESYSGSCCLHLRLCFPCFHLVLSKFTGLALRFWSILNWFLNRGKIEIQFQCSTCEYPVFPAPFVKKPIFSPVCFCPLCWEVNACSCVSFWILCSIPLVYVSVFVCCFCTITV
jgi:hypothetical protein